MPAVPKQLTGLAAGVVTHIPGVRHLLRGGADGLAHRMRYTAGQVEGMSHRLAGHESATVDDVTLADRVKSVLGPVEKRIDVPRVHVTACDRVVHLHGDVASVGDARILVRNAENVPGVGRVVSHLHVGLVASDTRPSTGAHTPSYVRLRLLDAAIAEGVPRRQAPAVVGAVLGALADRLPAGERAHVAAHLPADARALFATNGRRGGHPVRTADAFVRRVTSSAGSVPDAKAERVVRAVLDVVREAVPEEVVDVAAVLPEQLRDLWLPPIPIG